MLTLLAAIALGAPLGIAAGRLAWESFAGSPGAVQVTEVPSVALGLGLAVLVLAGNLLAFVPAALAARAPPGRLCEPNDQAVSAA